MKAKYIVHVKGEYTSPAFYAHASAARRETRRLSSIFLGTPTTLFRERLGWFYDTKSFMSGCELWRVI